MTHHLVLSVRGAIAWPPAVAKPYAEENNMTVEEFRDALLDELAKGHEVLPMGPCDNHDWVRGCLGHGE